MTLLTKRYDNLPFAHRQHTHPGHCSLVHGHNWSFEFTFQAEKPDENGFVIDFGRLGWLKQWLEYHFDHTLVVSAHDPMLEFFEGQEHPVVVDPLFKVRALKEGASAESIARFCLRSIQEKVQQVTEGRVSLFAVHVYEDERNSVYVSDQAA